MSLLAILLGALVAIASPPVAGASEEASYGQRGMVSSRSVHATAAGIEVMRAGGNAVDGAVATGFAIAVSYPNAGNLGGGGFAVIRLRDGTVTTLDHREVAPAAATRDMFLDDEGNVVPGLSVLSHLAAGVPGTVDGLLTLLERYGSLPREVVIAPAIRLAREGFPLDHDLARQLNTVLPLMAQHPASVAVFSRDDGEPWRAGDVFRQPALAGVLERIKDEGRAGFYEGEVADLIVREMERGGGIITHEDLSNYRSVWRAPIRGSYRGHDIYGMPPPSSGGVLTVMMLNMLEPLDIGAMGYGSAAATHALIEAMRRAYADRARHFGDPGFYDVPVDALISKSWARKRFADFDPARASRSADVAPGDLPAVPAGGDDTTHFSVMDGSGMVVALTTTLNSEYGSKIVVPGTGVLLNNEMDDFSAKAGVMNQFDLLGGEANAIAPGKRMLSSMSPTIVTRDGEPVLVTGSRGGSQIITTVLQVIINVIDHRMSVEDAVTLPRFHHQWRPDLITAEPFAFSPDTQRILEAMGHDAYRKTRIGRGIGDANSIEVVDGRIRGTHDPRREGAAIGF